MTKDQIILPSKQEAEDFLESLTTPQTSFSLEETIDPSERILQENNTLIDECNDLILERVRNQDASLRLSEVITAKDTAFKQNQLIQNKATENININVKELHNKTPDELLEMLEQLS